MPGKERPAASRLVIQRPPTTEPHHRNLCRYTKPSAGQPIGQTAEGLDYPITDSLGASPVLSALDHSARRDPGTNGHLEIAPVPIMRCIDAGIDRWNFHTHTPMVDFAGM